MLDDGQVLGTAFGAVRAARAGDGDLVVDELGGGKAQLLLLLRQGLEVLHVGEVKQVFSRFQRPFPDTNSHTADAAMRLQQGMLQISSSLGEVRRKQKTALDRRENARVEAEAAYRNYQDTRRLLRREETTLADRLRQSIAVQEHPRFESVGCSSQCFRGDGAASCSVCG